MEDPINFTLVIATFFDLFLPNTDVNDHVTASPGAPPA
jgi:hypothetical protein